VGQQGYIDGYPSPVFFFKGGKQSFFLFSFNYDIESLALSYLHNREDIFHFKVGHYSLHYVNFPLFTR
jgi:hypothetical protein